MNTYLETVSMSVFNRFMNLLLSHGKNPVIIGPALVWSAHSHGSLRSRAIRTIFNTTDFEFFITKAGIKSRFFKIIIQFLSTDHHIDSEPHLISIIGISIGYHVVSARSSVMNGCQAWGSHQFRDQFYPGLSLLPCDFRRDQFGNHIIRPFSNPTVKFPVSPVKFAMLRIGCFSCNACQCKRFAVIPGSMPAPVTYMNRITWSRFIQVFFSQFSSVLYFSIIVLETRNPFSVRRVLGALINGLLYGIYRT